MFIYLIWGHDEFQNVSWIGCQHPHSSTRNQTSIILSETQKKVVKHQLQTPGEQPQNLRCGEIDKEKGRGEERKRRTQKTLNICVVRGRSGWCDKGCVWTCYRRTEYTSDSCSVFTYILHRKTHTCLFASLWLNMKSPLLFSHLIILSLFISHSEYKEDIVFNQFVDKLP